MRDDFLFLDLAEGFDPYDVTCARCGKTGCCMDFIAEEGDEWECPTCWERCEAQERQFSST